LISFSTQPGNVALDGDGRNSPFASALVKHIALSTAPITDLLVAVRNDVIQATNRRQVPWENSALTGRFYFKGPPTAPLVEPSPAPSAIARPPDVVSPKVQSPAPAPLPPSTTSGATTRKPVCIFFNGREQCE
jgi:hypothetical protein